MPSTYLISIFQLSTGYRRYMFDGMKRADWARQRYRQRTLYYPEPFNVTDLVMMSPGEVIPVRHRDLFSFKTVMVPVRVRRFVSHFPKNGTVSAK